jgi:hypothetical protein
MVVVRALGSVIETEAVVVQPKVESVTRTVYSPVAAGNPQEIS